MQIHLCNSCKGIFKSRATLKSHICSETKQTYTLIWGTKDYPMLYGLSPKGIEFIYYADFCHCIIEIAGIRKTGIGDTETEAMINSLQNIQKEVA